MTSNVHRVSSEYVTAVTDLEVGIRTSHTETLSVFNNTIVASTHEMYGENSSFPIYAQVLLGIFFGVMALVNVIGNSCTIAAFVKDVKLRTVHNCYIVNLAFADMLVGLNSVPFYSVYTLRYYTWPFGRVFCKVFLAVDYCACAESAMTIILISYDRYKLVSLGAEYNNSQTTRGALVKISMSWLFSFLLYGPAIIGFDIWRGFSITEAVDCAVEFQDQETFMMIATFIGFGIPFSLTITFNSLIYWNIKMRSTKVHAVNTPIPNQQGNKGTTLPVATGSEVPKTDTNSNKDNSQTNKTIKKTNNLARHRKAARCLAIIVVTLAICWIPYELTAIILSFCKECVNEDLYESFVWLLWFNSSINPVLYAATNERFREHFVKMLCLSRLSAWWNKTRVNCRKNVPQTTGSQY